MQKGCWWVLDFSGAVTSSSGFPAFFSEQTSVALLWSLVEKEFPYPWDPSTQEILPSFRTLTNEAGRTLDLPRHGAARALPLVVNGVGCGSIRRGRGGDWYSQRIVKVKGEDLATLYSLRGDRARWRVGDPFRG